MTMFQPIYLIWQALLVLVSLKNLVAEAKVVRGELLTDANWKFLTRFCFKSGQKQPGKFEYSVMYDASYGDLNLDLYYDTQSQWPRVYGNRADLTSCRQKESVLKVKGKK